MDTRSKELFDKILAKDLSIISEADKIFIKARRSYLNQEQLKKFAFFLDEIKTPTPYVGESYAELMNTAINLGYKGKRMKMADLKKYIEEHKK